MSIYFPNNLHSRSKHFSEKWMKYLIVIYTSSKAQHTQVWMKRPVSVNIISGKKQEQLRYLWQVTTQEERLPTHGTDKVRMIGQNDR